jgi:uncharacterized protein (DUF2236 family)
VRLRHKVGLDLPLLEEGRAGDPGLFGPGSEVWRVGRERILLLGGPAALLLQLAHPLIAAGVANHSDFLADPFARLRATLDATLRISFGDSEQAEEAAERVRATHRGVRGALEDDVGPFAAGTAYDATDPQLALWVHATLVSVAIRSYELLVGPLSSDERAGYYGEAGRFARLFGVTDEVLPPTYESFMSYVETMEQSELLTVGPQARNLAGHVLDPPVPLILRLSRPASRALTAGLLPESIRRQLGLRWGRPERLILKGLTRTSRATIRAWPARLRHWDHYRIACKRVQMSMTGE